MKQKVAIGLSGGVDSSVAAALLVEQGYDVTGVYITCWSGPGCRSEEDRQDALDVALQLRIPFVHLDFQQAYKDKVYEYMIAEYQAGRTPNPDVMCNREIKFGLFYEWGLANGFEFIATGHYAQIKKSHKSEVISHKSIDSRLNTQDLSLARSVDEHKDQTYFLYQIRQEQLEHILFPIGHLTKPQVREEAIKRNLLTATKPDSQGICFIGEVSVSKFLEERIPRKEGKIVLNSPPAKAGPSLKQREGTLEVGKHRGVWFYTIGQKIGDRGQGAGNRVWNENLEKAGFDTTRMPHFYVSGKDIENNIIYIGTEDQLYTKEIRLTDMHWIDEKKYGKHESMGSMEGLLVRIRHGGELVPVQSITTEQTNHLTIKLIQPVWGVAPGQAVVLYDNMVCLGGGILA